MADPGVQGFADLAERLQDERNLALVCKALPKLPQEPLYALCQSLENAPLPPAVQGALFERIGKEQECAEPNAETLAYLCRALASCNGSSMRTNKLLTCCKPSRARPCCWPSPAGSGPT